MNNFFIYESKKNKVMITSIYFLICLTLLQQMPLIKDLYYSQIRIVLYVSFGVLSFMSISTLKRGINHLLIKIYIVAILYTFLLAIATFFQKEFLVTLFLELMIPFGILIVSMKNKLNKRQINQIIYSYIVLSTVLGITSVLYYGEGFNISQTYFLEAKNQIGPILVIGSIISLHNLLFETKKNNVSYFSSFIFKWILFFSLVSSIILIRNRAGLISLLIIVAFMIVIKIVNKNLTYKKVIFFTISLSIGILLYVFGAFDFMVSSFEKSLTYNYNVSNLNSLSAGRFDVYIYSLSFIKENLFFGELTSINNFPYSTHNYFLNKTIALGLLGAIPIITLYLFLWLYVFYKIKKDMSNILPYLLLLSSLIISIFEYTYPYGPGVSQMLVWFLIGQTLINEKSEDKSLKKFNK